MTIHLIPGKIYIASKKLVFFDKEGMDSTAIDLTVDKPYLLTRVEETYFSDKDAHTYITSLLVGRNITSQSLMQALALMTDTSQSLTSMSYSHKLSEDGDL